MTDRVIALIDMDCFYCQVETKLNPDLKGLPLAVVQYNEWKGGGIIAVNYEARDRGVTRYMRGQDAKKQCPEIILVKVPTLRDKADLSRYREAGREVVAVLGTFSDCVERASVDEAYVDLTTAVNKMIAEKSSKASTNELTNTFIVGYTSEGSNNEEDKIHGLKSWLSDIYDTNFHDVTAQKLAIGAVIVEEMRKAVFETTGFRCSAGIAHNKVLAKLACGLHKPNRQTVLPQSSVTDLYKKLPVKKVRSLGGKLGDDLMDRFGIKVIADLVKFSESELQKFYDSKTGTWLFNIARGYDYDAVTPRLLSKSIGCCKKFPGRTALTTGTNVQHWVTKLAEELLERLNEDQITNKRRAQLLTVSMGLEINQKDIASSKSSVLTIYSLDRIVKTAQSALKKACTEDPVTKIWSPPIKYLGLSAGKFVNESSNKIINFFKTTDVFEEKPIFSLKEENSCSVERLALQDVSNNSEVTVKVSIVQSEEEKQPSFFEKVLFQGFCNNEGKLNILPDLHKPVVPSENENSRDSCISEKLTHLDSNVDSPQKNETLCIKKNINSENNDLFEHNLQSKKDEGSSEANLSKTNKKSILSFFASAAKKEKWINPAEIFPDLSLIDDDVIEILPLSFREKIIKLRKASGKSKKIENSSVEKVDILNLSDSEIRLQGDKNGTKEDRFQVTNAEVPFDGNEFENNSFNKCCTSSEYIKCNECGENVAIEEKDIHLDLHVALKLDNELNRKSGLGCFNSNLNKLNKAHVGNKRKNNDTNNKVIKKTKGIEAFFRK